MTFSVGRGLPTQSRDRHVSTTVEPGPFTGHTVENITFTYDTPTPAQPMGFVADVATVPVPVTTTSETLYYADNGKRTVSTIVVVVVVYYSLWPDYRSLVIVLSRFRSILSRGEPTHA